MKKGEIYIVNFSPSVGREIQKLRPALVVQSKDISSSLVTLIPLSSKIHKMDADEILIKKDAKNRLFIDSILKIRQVSSFDYSRIQEYIGVVDQKVLGKLDIYLRKHFDI